MTSSLVKLCSRCILDNSIEDIWFDNDGKCKYCYMHDEMEKIHPLNDRGRHELEKLIEKIKADGKNKKYDCIAGVSGGRDSTYTLYKAVEFPDRVLLPLGNHPQSYTEFS